MSQTRKPSKTKKVKKADPSSPYAPTSWGERVGFDFEVPSGQRLLMKKADIPDLMKSGILQDLDLLSGIVETDLLPENAAVAAKAKQAAEKGMASMSDEEAAVFLRVLDAVVIATVVLPPLNPVPEDDEERVEGAVYVDQVRFDDRIAIFEKAMEGLEELATFREGSAGAGDSVADQ